MADLKLVFSAKPQLTVVQLARKRGWNFISRPGRFVLEGPNAKFHFEEDGLRTCQTVVETTLASVLGGVPSAPASSGYSYSMLVESASKFVQDDDVNRMLIRGVQHVMDKRRTGGISELPVLTFAEAVTTDLASFVVTAPTGKQLDFLKFSFPEGQLVGSDFRVGTLVLPPYDLEAMKKAVSDIIDSPVLDNQVEDTIPVPQNSDSSLKLLSELRTYKDFNTLAKAAASGKKRAVELRNMLQTIPKQFTATQTKTLAKQFPSGKLPAHEYVAKVAEVLHNKYGGKFDDVSVAAQVLIWLRPQCLITEDHIEKRVD